MIHLAMIAALVTAQPPDPCAQLAAEYENASKALAISFAEGYSDRSAPRRAMREAQDANVISRAAVTLTLMREGNCPMPSSSPNAGPYLVQAMRCRTEQMRNQLAILQRRPVSDDSAVCDVTTWVASQ